MSFEELLTALAPTLKRIVYKLRYLNGSWDSDDLFQEAVVHLWKEFEAGSLIDKTRSYILQGCYFHLRNYIRVQTDKVRLVSVDAPRIEEQEGSSFEQLMVLESPVDTREVAHCDMLIAAIRNNGLSEREKEVFMFALEGLTTREIGARMGISHVRVVKISASMREKCKKHMDVL
ncbi:MAG TPA: sigma-70 family RNA polymerase sigma factor [Candidatus Omnitrophota bacterium]|nr:sigma-70 family RNA polymerase sigma factor [Candidatus Omnitrophota bacterium]